MVYSVQEGYGMNLSPDNFMDIELKHHLGMWTAIWRGWNDHGTWAMANKRQHAIDGLMRLLAAKRKE